MSAEGSAIGIVSFFFAILLFAWPLLYKCVQVAVVYWRVPWTNAKGERMRGELPKLPYGHFHQVNFFGRPLSKTYGPIYYIWHCLTPVLILADAEAIRSFYTDHYSHQRDRDFTCLGSVFQGHTWKLSGNELRARRSAKMPRSVREILLRQRRFQHVARDWTGVRDIHERIADR
ncbi:hypothetical protein OS493_006326 [Desmophyllum pertusum]|uniref:Cytochrome P450 n=1 Tax=Desmophyllum pertusum TaxID=174260 RepID=A0A9X0A575_9CNID|nr:hypothetical protein OS493_006326 [Desmophyllum pertusum]